MGALFLGVIKNALPVVNISPFWQLAISGAAIIVAVAFNVGAERPRGRVILQEGGARSVSAPIPDHLSSPRRDAR